MLKTDDSLRNQATAIRPKFYFYHFHGYESSFLIEKFKKYFTT